MRRATCSISVGIVVLERNAIPKPHFVDKPRLQHAALEALRFLWTGAAPRLLRRMLQFPIPSLHPKRIPAYRLKQHCDFFLDSSGRCVFLSMALARPLGATIRRWSAPLIAHL